MSQGPIHENSVAVIGMACNFPDAASPEAFWNNIAAGHESVIFPSDEDLSSAGVSDADLRNPRYVKATVPFPGAREFDAGFFGFSPRDARVMDPQHRKFLECAWNALEHGSHTPESCEGSIGVFAGVGMNWYLIRHVLSHPALVEDMGEFLVRHLSNDKDFLSTQVSYQLNLKGPSLSVQTACSTSLVAIHMACQSVLSGECEMALAGGSTIDNPLGHGYLHREEEVRSIDGHCRAFDANSSGTLFGSGCGVVLLRPLEEAIEDGDTVHAIIRGSSVNNDGSGKVSYLAPSVDGQAAAIKEAMEIAEVEPRSISYIETHGTATKLGDPIEVAALTSAFGDTEEKQYCAIGSVKTNIGHLDTAAGVAGFIKVVESLKHRQIAPSLHYKAPNPEIDFESTPFFVSSSLTEWEAGTDPRRAAVNSLGVGGTNSHLILEEALLEEELPVAVDHPQCLLISARTRSVLQRRVADLADYFEKHPNASLLDVAHTLRVGRVAMPLRTSIAATNVGEAIEMLRRNSNSVQTQKSNPPLVFMFPGQGAQYPNMAISLYETEPVFKAALDECFSILAGLDMEQVREAIYPGEMDLDDAATALQYIAVTQPGLFCIEYSLARLLMSRGLQPDAMTGHSSGEYVAACLAGVFTLKAAVKLMCQRGRLIASQPPSTMIAVSLSENKVYQYESDDVSVASINGEELAVLAGATESILKIEEELSNQDIMVRRVQSSHAGHNHYLDDVLDEFEQCIIEAAPAKPQLRFISNVTGTWITDDQAQDPRYWCTHLRRTVKFKQGLAELASEGDRVFIEVGPGTTLARFAEASLGEVEMANVIPCLPHPKDPTPSNLAFANIAGLLWAKGVSIDWEEWRWNSKGKKTTLPVYPFQPDEHWLEVAEGVVDRKVEQGRKDLSDWFSLPRWKSSLLSISGDESAFETCLLFLDNKSNLDTFSPLLANFKNVHFAYTGDSFKRTSDSSWQISADHLEDYKELLTSLSEENISHVIYQWSLDVEQDQMQRYCFDAPFLLASAWQQVRSVDEDVIFSFLSRNAMSVSGDSALNPAASLLAGPARVISQELESVNSCWLDFDSMSLSKAVRFLSAELGGKMIDSSVAFRGRSRLVPSFDSISIDESLVNTSLVSGACYLVTGGFGGIGYLIAEHLAEKYQAHIILTSRVEIPDGSGNAVSVLAEGGIGGAQRRTSMVSRLKALGASVTVVHCDLLDQSFAERLSETGISRLDGVFHTAGVLDDGLLGLKSLSSCHAVLAPKVTGTENLAYAIEPYSPGFCALFSSVSAYAGIQGQVDYTSANVFLDTFAAQKNADSDIRYIAIDWSVWRDVGMATGIAVDAGFDFKVPDNALYTNLPILDRVEKSENGFRFFGTLTGVGTWVLNEHRTRMGVAVLPGTGYVDLIYSALRYLNEGIDQSVAIDNLIFLSPVMLSEIDKRVLVLELISRETGQYHAAFRSFGTSAEDEIEHALATVTLRNVPCQNPIPVEETVIERKTHEHPDIVFGEHWNCIEEMGLSNGIAQVTVKATEPGEISRFPMHPAMLDMAVGAPQSMLSLDELLSGLVPYQYREIQILAPLTANIESRARRVDEGDGVVTYDVDIYADGELVVYVRGFELRTARQRQGGGFVMTDTPSTSMTNPLLATGIKEGITNPEGMRALELILGSGLGHVVVAPTDLERLISGVSEEEDSLEEGESESRSERPELSVAYVKPDEGTEETIAGLWQEILGIDGIGKKDNFFELGGHSLLLTRIVSRLKQRHQMVLPLDEIFDKATIGEWAKLAVIVEFSSQPKNKLKRVSRADYKR